MLVRSGVEMQEDGRVDEHAETVKFSMGHSRVVETTTKVVSMDSLVVRVGSHTSLVSV